MPLSIRKLLSIVSGVLLLLAGPSFAGPAQPTISQAAPPGPSYPAADFTVNDPTDPGSASCSAASCSLRAAITAANAGGLPGVHTIAFSLTIPVTITLSSALPVITGTLTIAGPGAMDLAINGNGNRVFQVGDGAALHVSGIAIRKGYALIDGAGILNDHGTLTVASSILAQNLSNNEGGGLKNEGGTAVISDTLFLDNHAFHHGAISNSGKLTVANSIFQGNHARLAGAIFNSGTLTVTNTAFSENVGQPSSGGAILNGGMAVVANSTFYANGSNIGGAIDNGGGTFDITNSTFSGNTAGYGGTIVVGGGNVTLRNTILAGGAGVEVCYLNGGTLTAGADSLTTDATCGAATLKTLAELALGALQPNGGPTPTVALLFGSAAIDAGDDAACAAAIGAPAYGAGGADQRGVSRPQGPHCDSGAFERVAAYLVYFPVLRR